MARHCRRSLNESNCGGAVVSERDEQVLEEFKQFVHDTAPVIHGTLSGEIWKILLESGRE